VSSTTDRILAETRLLLAEHGAAVSMAQVAAAAGVSRQAVYLHYPSRAQLLIAVVRQMDDEADIRARCTAALQTADPVGALEAFLDVWLRFADDIRPVATMLLAARHSDADAWTAWQDRMTDLRGGHRYAMRRLADAGRLRAGLDADTAADLAWALTSVPVWEQLTVDRRWSATRARRHVVQSVILAVTN